MNLKQNALKAFSQASTMIQKDLQALPESAFTHHFGGTSRTVADIVHEINLVNQHITMILRGEEPFEWPDGGWITAPPDFNSKDAIIAAFNETCQMVMATAESFPEDGKEETVTDEHGVHTRYDRIRFMAFHMAYHSGQFNFMQTLLGDDKWNW